VQQVAADARRRAAAARAEHEYAIADRFEELATSAERLMAALVDRHRQLKWMADR
jgi:hypothetical protein